MTLTQVKRLAVAVALGLLIGFIGWLRTPSLVMPSRAEIRAAARSFVPPGGRIVEEGENTGDPLIVGRYHASVGFTLGGLTERDVIRRAMNEGWGNMVNLENDPNNYGFELFRDGIRAHFQSIDPGDPHASVIVDWSITSERRWRWGISGVGFGLGASATWVTVAIKRRRNRKLA